VAAFDPERVQLSLLVEKDQLWVGLSRINEFQVIPRNGHEWDELAKKLAEHRQSAFFVDREDLEIAGDTGVSYGDIVHAIDAASKAGFPWWQLTDPQGLSARPSL
jgi:biopolymer transport protein ExbD